MTRKKCMGSELSVFMGVEAKLNFAIFLILAVSDYPLKNTELLKLLNKQKKSNDTYYGSITKRLRCLVNEEYLKENKVGSEAATYQLTNKALLAMLWNSNNMQEILDKASEKKRGFLLLALANSILE
jgi:hypothetical protein